MNRLRRAIVLGPLLVLALAPSQAGAIPPSVDQYTVVVPNPAGPKLVKPRTPEARPELLSPETSEALSSPRDDALVRVATAAELGASEVAGARADLQSDSEALPAALWNGVSSGPMLLLIAALGLATAALGYAARGRGGPPNSGTLT